MNDPDASFRLAAFKRLRLLVQLHGGSLPWSEVNKGFVHEGARIHFATKAEGIFKPAPMTGVLSVTTVVLRAGRRARV